MVPLIKKSSDVLVEKMGEFAKSGKAVEFHRCIMCVQNYLKEQTKKPVYNYYILLDMWLSYHYYFVYIKLFLLS